MSHPRQFRKISSDIHYSLKFVKSFNSFFFFFLNFLLDGAAPPEQPHSGGVGVAPPGPRAGSIMPPKTAASTVNLQPQRTPLPPSAVNLTPSL